MAGILVPVPAILRLPIELRQQIYSYLLPRENVSHPLPSVGITSVSHRPPSARLLSIHPTISSEILDQYYAITTWKLIFSHAFNFFRVDPDLYNLERCPSLRRLRQVEVVFFCDILLLKEYPSFGLGSFCAEIRRRADRACDVLLKAQELSSVTVSWIDTTNTGGWEDKAKILSPLRKLRGRVDFQIGEINGPDDVDQEAFVRAMQEVLGSGRRVHSGEQASKDEPSQLRMLAFDIRQERQCLRNTRPHERVGYAEWPRLTSSHDTDAY